MLVGSAAVTAIGLQARSEGKPAPTNVIEGVETISVTGRGHVPGQVTYDRIPAAGGDHSPTWLTCGIYEQPVPNEKAVHSLEHGAVWIAYQPSLHADQIGTLRELVQGMYDPNERYLILAPYPTLASPVVVTAWGNQLTLERVSDDRIGKFIDRFRGGPQSPERGSQCLFGGMGNPTK